MPKCTTPVQFMVSLISSNRNLLNFFFTGQALVDGSQKNLPTNNQRFTGTPLSSITIMQAEILDVKQMLRRCKAPGPDNIYRILHEATYHLPGPLSQSFNYSLHCCKIPSTRKLSNVCLILPFLPITGVCLFRIQWKRYWKE